MTRHYGMLPSQMNTIPASDIQSYMNWKRCRYIRNKKENKKNG